ncbi:MAG: SUMF1/EgtB/PvdO family nonheme iron enzyme [Pseudomonadota bacterium]|nr:SUMF1/EgtB/PvdO family nonheme iron enzyme [Pseudomonadota bacterium]
MDTLHRGTWLVCFGMLILAAPGLALAAKKTEDARGLQPVLLTVPGEARPVALYGESHALVIGASDYHNGWPKLPGVHDDIDAVGRALEKQGFAVSKVLNPAGDKLDKSIRRFIGQHGQKPDSRLLIYFTGHGYTMKPDAERQLGYLVPVDAPLADRDPGGFIEAALSMESLEGYAKQIRAKHALFVFDSCFSGSFFKMRAAPELIALKTMQPVRQFITSGGADQQVPDVSVFRRQFIAALNGEGDLNNDGYITGSELGSFLEDKVTNYSRRTQIPQYGKIRDPALDKGDFVFALAKPEARPEPVREEAAAPRAGGMRLDDLKQQQAVRDGWTAWQTRMRADHGQVAAMNAAPELKAAAWARFLATYPEANPYSDEAETLREQARQVLAEAKSQTTWLADGGERAPAAKKKAPAAAVNAGQIIKDCDVCPEMVVLPAGRFAMGSNDHSDEKPVHSVDVGAFALARTEVTQGQWRAVMGNNPSNFSRCGDDCPVEKVSWDDAQDYVRKLSARTGQHYRLPSEAEWEYAARAGTTTKYWWGDQASHEYMNYGKDECCGGLASGRDQWVNTAPVGQFPANVFGLHDMNGNVWEWVADCSHGSYSGAPSDGGAWQGGDCSRRVFRGGSWYGSADDARAADRYWIGPTNRFDYLGFRPTRTLP